MTSGLQARGLTWTRAAALWTVARQEALTQRQLADLLRVTPRNVTSLIDGLEQTGFVARTAHASDRRSTVIRLTDKGRTTVAQLDEEATALARDLFGALSPADLAVVMGALDRIAARFGGAAPMTR